MVVGGALYRCSTTSCTRSSTCKGPSNRDSQHSALPRAYLSLFPSFFISILLLFFFFARRIPATFIILGRIRLCSLNDDRGVVFHRLDRGSHRPRPSPVPPGAPPAFDPNCLLVADLDVVEAAYFGQAGVMARALVLPPGGAPERSARASSGPSGPTGGSGKKHKSWALENEVPLPEFPPPSLDTIRAHFATPNGTVIVAQTAATATLPCVVKKPNLGAVSNMAVHALDALDGRDAPDRLDRLDRRDRRDR